MPVDAIFESGRQKSQKSNRLLSRQGRCSRNTKKKTNPAGEEMKRHKLKACKSKANSIGANHPCGLLLPPSSRSNPRIQVFFRNHLRSKPIKVSGHQHESRHFWESHRRRQGCFLKCAVPGTGKTTEGDGRSLPKSSKSSVHPVQIDTKVMRHKSSEKSISPSTCGRRGRW